ncbi:MAG TPA: aminotransferase class I/II-fold pyridoxal phosphate-dependent enzyme [Candidatus Coatesbacteria bacterium]|nr:aminotransferase class I/II-fold pyridoxal phosphate-dependent enzyme [Candidatus Coatesbacteria bacterium]
MRPGLGTRFVHGGDEHDPATGAVSTPIYQVSTFAFKSAEHGAACFSGEEDGYIYSRLDNPTVRVFEKKMAFLEGAGDGLAFASGMAAIHNLLCHAAHGGHVVSGDTVYGGTFALFEHLAPKLGIRVSFVDTSDAGNIERAMRPETRLVFVETPSNPTLALTDIAAAAELAHSNGALLAVDNTFCSPYLQRPLEHGADVALHSCTKYVGGHGDAVAGAYCGSEELIAEAREWRTDIGGVIAPLQCWLLLRGLKTLHLRVERSQANAVALARFLNGHPKVERVHYPGLESHPGFEAGRRQMDGPGGILSFNVAGGVEAGARLINSVRLMTVAVSLGDCATLIEHPASMTHSTMSPEEQAAYGIAPGLVRIAAGLEDADDLLEDLEQALAKL